MDLEEEKFLGLVDYRCKLLILRYFCITRTTKAGQRFPLRRQHYRKTSFVNCHVFLEVSSFKIILLTGKCHSIDPEHRGIERFKIF